MERIKDTNTFQVGGVKIMEDKEKQQEVTTENKNIEKKRKIPGVKGFLKTVSAGIIGSLLTLGIAPHLDIFNNNVPTQAVEETGAQTDLNVQHTSASANSISDIVEQSSKAIVGISNIQGTGQNSLPTFDDTNEVQSGTGSGVIYQVTDDAMYIVTNNHVIENATKIEVTLYNEETITAELVGTDPLTDIAVLKVSGNFDITALSFGDSDSLRAGDEVIAIGNPLGLDLYGTVTQGIVSAVNRTINVSTSAGAWDMEVIQTDAAINPGNSGGALINTSGELVGINSMKIAQSQIEGLGFSIPSNEVKTLIKELTKNGQIIRPYLGVIMENLSDIPRSYVQNIAGNVTEGVLITKIDESGPATQAGLKTGDIIVAVNGEKVKNANELRKYLYTDVKVGDDVKMTYYRQGKSHEAEITLTSKQPSK